MILWHDNIINSNIDYDDIISKIVDNDNYYSAPLDLHTTYQMDDAPDSIVADFYGDVISRFMTDLGLYHRCRYNFGWWTQIYSGNNNSTHPPHDHFDHGVILSWIHFVKPPKQDCFCFVDSNGNQTFPKTQRQNDFIVFPSFILHQAVPFESDEDRVIIAGNITVKTYEQIDNEWTRVSNFTKLANDTSVYQAQTLRTKIDDTKRKSPNYK